MDVQHAEQNLRAAQALHAKWIGDRLVAAQLKKAAEEARLSACIAQQALVVNYWAAELERRKKG